MFSARTNWKLTQNPLSVKLESMRKKGISILDLTESNPTRAGFSYPKEILKSFNASRNLKYHPDPKGMLSARKIIVRYYGEKGIRIDPGQIVLTSSTSEAYSHLFRLLANPGEEVLVPEPSYPLFEYLASLNDVKLKPYQLSYEKRWHIEPPNPDMKSRAILLVHPNNPTGNFVKRKELEQLNQIAKEKNLALISDEVFLDYAFERDQARVATFAGNQSALTFTLSGISKILGLPQMKLGWIVVSGPEKLRQGALERLEVIADTFLSVSTPVQNAIQAWFKQRVKIQGEIRKRVKSNLRSICPPESCQLLHVEGGWYATIRIPRIHSEENWVMKFLEKDRVWVQPGYFFDFPNEAYLIVSLLTPEKIFKQGMKRIFSRIQRE